MIELKKGSSTYTNSLCILLNTNKYTLPIWWNDRTLAAPSGSHLTFKGENERFIRENASEVLAVRSKRAYNSKVNWCTTKAMRVKLTSSLVNKHIVNSADGCGRQALANSILNVFSRNG